jgi:hypothetical protein
MEPIERPSAHAELSMFVMLRYLLLGSCVLRDGMGVPTVQLHRFAVRLSK